MSERKNRGILSSLCGLFCLLGIESAYAVSGDTGVCESYSGVKQHTVIIKSGDINSDNNQVGTILKDQGNFPQTSYNGFCDCDKKSTPPSSVTYFTATTSGKIQKEIDGLKYYEVQGDAKDYLYASTQLFVIQGQGGTVGKLFNVPFEQKSNDNKENTSCWNGNVKGTHLFMTGARGIVNLYIAKEFTGTMNISPTTLAVIRGSKNKNTIDIAPDLARVILQGDVHIPLSCKVNAGSVIQVDLGEIPSNNFKTVGSKPENYTPKPVDVNIECNNKKDNIKVNVSFDGDHSTDASLLNTTNKNDIAIKLLHGTEAIKFGQTKVPLPLNQGNGSLSLTSYPVKTKQTVTSGEFEANATITVTQN